MPPEGAPVLVFVFVFVFVFVKKIIASLPQLSRLVSSREFVNHLQMHC